MAPSGFVYVTESDNNRVQKFTSDGTFVAKWGSYGAGPGQFSSPTGVCVDAAGGVYVTDLFNARVQKFDAAGGFLTTWYVASAQAVAVDASRNVFVVSQQGTPRVSKFVLAPVPVTGTTWGRLKAMYR